MQPGVYLSDPSAAGGTSVIINLTAAEIKTLQSAPIDLSAYFPATPTGYWRVTAADIQYNDGAATFTNTIQVSCNSATQCQYSYDLSLLFGGGDVLFGLTNRQSVGVTVYRTNKELLIDASGDSATGDGTATIYVSAILVTV